MSSLRSRAASAGLAVNRLDLSVVDGPGDDGVDLSAEPITPMKSPGPSSPQLKREPSQSRLRLLFAGAKDVGDGEYAGAESELEASLAATQWLNEELIKKIAIDEREEHEKEQKKELELEETVQSSSSTSTSMEAEDVPCGGGCGGGRARSTTTQPAAIDEVADSTRTDALCGHLAEALLELAPPTPAPSPLPNSSGPPPTSRAAGGKVPRTIRSRQHAAHAFAKLLAEAYA